MTIRTATPDDIPAISRVMAASWKAGYRGIVPDDYLDHLRDDHWVSRIGGIPDIEMIVLLDGYEIIGAAGYGPARDAACAGWGELVSLYILPAYFDRGTGVALLDAAVAALRVMGYKDAYLWVLKDNLRGRHFYEKHGWRWGGDESTVEIEGVALVDLRYIRALHG